MTGHKTDKNDSEWICQLLLQRIRECNRKLTVEIAELDRRIKEIVAPYAEVMERLDEIPGLHDRTLEDLIAEIGLDMTVYPRTLNPQGRTLRHLHRRTLP